MIKKIINNIKRDKDEWLLSLWVAILQVIAIFIIDACPP